MSIKKKGKVKDIPKQAWIRLYGSGMFSVAGGRVVSRGHRPPYPEGISLVLISVRG
jgi:hypothetical protein